MIIYKALSKQEFAEDAGVSPAQFRKWCKSNEAELKEFGVEARTKILPPAAVGLLARKYQVMPRNATIL